eukprot:Opistho-2@50434
MRELNTTQDLKGTGVQAHVSTLINPLANPKGTKHVCELCSKAAYVQCESCRVTFYCGKEHQKVDHDGIHDKICQLLIPLRTTTNILGSEEERQHRERQRIVRQRHIMELTKTEAQKLLYQGQYDLAIPAAMQALRFSIDVYGSAAIELVPSYLLLGEASIGMGRFEQAEEYLSHAKWAVLKAPECDPMVKSRLYRNFGLLYEAQGSMGLALQQLAADVHHSSLVYGADHISTSGGFYHLGNILWRQGNSAAALSQYDVVIKIWNTYLTKSVITNVGRDADSLDEAQEAEAVQMLRQILAVREEQYGHTHAITLSTCHTLAMLHYALCDPGKAREYALRAMGGTSSKDELRALRVLLDKIENDRRQAH